jgi:hypothetical protein
MVVAAPPDHRLRIPAWTLPLHLFAAAGAADQNPW